MRELSGIDRILRDLEEQRLELLAQLAAVDTAIAALAGAGSVSEALEPDAPVEQADGEVLPRRVKAKRVLSDAHKQALVVSKRRAREIQEAAKGLAREKHPDSFVPAIGKRGDGQAPRLVKRPGRT